MYVGFRSGAAAGRSKAEQTESESGGATLDSESHRTIDVVAEGKRYLRAILLAFCLFSKYHASILRIQKCFYIAQT